MKIEPAIVQYPICPFPTSYFSIEDQDLLISDFQKKGKWKTTLQGPDGKRMQTRAYRIWQNMKQRANPNGRIQRDNPSYIGVTVCREFQDFQFFAEWCQSQIGYLPGAQLDKELLYRGNKQYSPMACCFVPAKINSLLVKCDAKRGNLPIGVTRSGNRYKATCSDGERVVFLGTHATPEGAFRAYKTFKEDVIMRRADDCKNFMDYAVYTALATYEVTIDD